MGYGLASLLGYVLGSVPVALLVARRHGVDLRSVGDGNPGAWNALEQLGARRAWPAFVGDGLKGLAAGAAGHALAGWAGSYIGVGAAIAGHAFPLFSLGRGGGKGVMAFAGGGFALSPAAALAALAVGAAVSAARSFAWGARAGVAAFPLLQLAVDPVERVVATGALMTAVGALFLARRRTPARASASRDARPTG